MDSRPGRTAASRYGTVPQPEPPHPPLMNGPVRKWRKQWVQCEGGSSRGRNSRPAMVYKWVPISDEEAKAEELSTKRRFRYIPIAALENKNTGTPEKVSKEAAESTKVLSNGIAKMTMAVDDASQKLSEDASQKLSDGGTSNEKQGEDQSNVNTGQGDGSYSGASGANNCVWSSKMMIEWEDELMSSM